MFNMVFKFRKFSIKEKNASRLKLRFVFHSLGINLAGRKAICLYRYCIYSGDFEDKINAQTNVYSLFNSTVNFPNAIKLDRKISVSEHV